MPTATKDRAARLRAALAGFDPTGLLQWLVAIVLVALLVRLLWTVLTPVGPVGNWAASSAANRSTAVAMLGSFDPFFRSQPQQGPVTVTSLQLTLHGVRLNEAAGGGSAIIGTPDGVQNSFAVGDEILPGVTLSRVAFDTVTITRGGVEEQIFLDQSDGAAAATPASTDPSSDSTDFSLSDGSGGLMTAEQLRSGISFTPRMTGGRLTGFVLAAQGDGEIFRRAGFRPGDILVAAEGRSLAAPADVEQLIARAAQGGTLSVSVERGAEIVPIAITVRQ